MLNQSCETKYVSFIGVIVGIHTHPDCGKSIEENKTLLWAKKIFKTRPNKNIKEEFRNKININIFPVNAFFNTPF